MDQVLLGNDQTGQFLGLGFPGGPVIESLATEGNKAAFNLPRPLGRSGTFDFSFSGLKTSLVNKFKGRDRKTLPLADIAASFQQAVVDVLVSKTLKAAQHKGVSAVSITGGVSINRRLREDFSEACKRQGLLRYRYFSELGECCRYDCKCRCNDRSFNSFQNRKNRPRVELAHCNRNLYIVLFGGIY